MNFSQLPHGIWTDPRFLDSRLTPEARLLYLWLLSHPEMDEIGQIAFPNISQGDLVETPGKQGVERLPLRCLNVRISSFLILLRSLSSVGLISYFQEESKTLILVRDYIAYYLDKKNKKRQEKIIHALRHLSETLQRRGFLAFLETKYPELFGEVGKPSGLSVPLKDGSYHEFTEDLVAAWEREYPDLDVRFELQELIRWNQDNPSKRKTKTGMSRHVQRWFANARRAMKYHRTTTKGKRGRSGQEYDLLSAI